MTRGNPGAQSGLLGTFRDFGRGLSLWRIWTALAWEELNDAFSRSFLGLSWIALSFLAFLMVKLLIFTNLLPDTGGDYYSSYLVCGLMIWRYLQPAIINAPTSFLRAAGWIKNDPLPLSLYVYKDTLKEMLALLCTLPAGFILFAFLQTPVGLNGLWALASLPVFFVNAVWLKIVLGTFGARYRDIGHLITTIMAAMMFLTPIFWTPAQIGSLVTYLKWNPLYHYLAIFRAPLIDNVVPLESWMIVGAITVVGWTLALASFTTYRNRIVFWL